MEKIDSFWYKIEKFTDPLGERETKILRNRYTFVLKDTNIRKDDGYYFTSWCCDFGETFYRNKFEDFSEMLQYLDIIDILSIISYDKSDHKLIVSKLESLLDLLEDKIIKFDLDFDDSIIKRVIRKLSGDPKISATEFPYYDNLLRNIKIELDY